MNWIKTSERMPIVGQKVIAYPVYGDVDYAYIDETYHKKIKRFKCSRGLCIYNKVTHWMPMPQKPEE